jgi:hypothetical protein
MNINLKNAIDHFYPNPSYEQVYFEAIANAIDAGATEIELTIDIDAYDKPESLKVTIRDNGSGFTDMKFRKFSSLLEAEKDDHKGLGRLVYLAYFDEVQVRSFFEGIKKRDFVFNKNFEGSSRISEVDEQESGSTLTYRSFSGAKVHRYDYLKPETIVTSVRRHFYPLFFVKKHNGESLKIEVRLNTKASNDDHGFYSGSKQLTLNDLPELEKTTIQSDEVDWFQKIDIHFSVERVQGTPTSVVTDICVDGRTIDCALIPPESLPSGTQAIFLFSSDYFIGKTDSSRQRLELPKGITEKTLRRVLRSEIGVIINAKLPLVKEENDRKSEELSSHFPHLNGYFESEIVGLIKKDEALEDAQRKYFLAQKYVLEGDELDDGKFEAALEVSSRMLTEYILFRTLIIKKLKAMSPENSEADIHNLIVPRYETFKKQDFIQNVYRNNAWLLDDKYMSYNTILSDEDMDKVVSAITLEDDVEKDPTRPDITLIFSGDPEEQEKVDVVVVELKKQTANEGDNMKSVLQLMQRAEKLALYQEKIQRIWYYAVIQINDSFGARLTQMNWSPLFSHGKVFYQEFKTKDSSGNEIPTPTYVLSYDALINDAECRNATFLEILKQGIKSTMKQ